MARTSNNGTAQIVSTEDFNVRVKLAFENKINPELKPMRAPQPFRAKWQGGKP
ncbi:hypothetical protein [Methylobacterium longum]|uniref:Uncharacterized protein n=1 Tax=Methylobacterium longum TaxID=767694 RepID=A0ABT8ATN9_9HYPH|nr:hypothetical protein [Methylobacterium longum]MDN3573302.1 hypothetical protein [Methylobacterium longum]GJE14982.1 hypothetical protein FOHLNKBM_6059 [Methylobacterium longum]